jgi:hypothetical protein
MRSNPRRPTELLQVEQWSRDGQRALDLVFAGNSLDKARRIFDRIIKHRPRKAASRPPRQAARAWN